MSLRSRRRHLRSARLLRRGAYQQVYFRSIGCSWRSDGLPSKYRDGHVCHQQPYPNTRQSSGVPLNLELAERTSMRAMPMPSVVGMRFQQAKRLLERRGFKKVVRRPSTDKSLYVRIPELRRAQTEHHFEFVIT